MSVLSWFRNQSFVTRVDNLPKDILYYLELTNFRDMVRNSVDLVIWSRNMKKYSGLALFDQPYPPKKIKIKLFDEEHIYGVCFRRSDIQASIIVRLSYMRQVTGMST